jgi:hypothetical protein
MEGPLRTELAFSFARVDALEAELGPVYGPLAVVAGCQWETTETRHARAFQRAFTGCCRDTFA